MAMDLVSAYSWLSLYLALFLLQLPSLLHSQPPSDGSANIISSWTISPEGPGLTTYEDGSQLRHILLDESVGQKTVFAVGFYCDGNCSSFVFGVFISYVNGIKIIPEMVWSANRNSPVTMNASLELTSRNGFVMFDATRRLVWSTTNAQKSVAAFNLTRNGNLVVVGEDGSIVWESFNHPTDSLLPGQYLKVGQNLTSSVSTTNRSEGLFSLSLDYDRLLASVRSNPSEFFFINYTACRLSYLVYNSTNESMDLGDTLSKCTEQISLPPVDVEASFIRLEPDGHLKLYNFDMVNNAWLGAADVFQGYINDCDYPMACGRNGICGNGKCECPNSINGTSYFELESKAEPVQGCSPITPLSCEAYDLHTFVELKDASYFAIENGFYENPQPTVYEFNFSSAKNLSDTCKLACLRNCSCKASFFVSDEFQMVAYCYLLPEIFSLKNSIGVTAFLKVQNVALKPNVSLKQNVTSKRINEVPRILAYCAGALAAFLFLFGFIYLLFWKKRDAEELEEDCFDQMPGMLVRFSYKDLLMVTLNFTRKIGEGGFGSVFEGTLSDGTKVAVKCLDGLECRKKSFVAEVETVGSIHHVNLVRLIGFCIEKSHRLLVYEFMPNGSLDKWIFTKSTELRLDWLQRRNIILGIAKGLAYLHEECRKKVIHMDIKPENILLDDNLNAKVADFGLSKLIDREQSQFLTTIRGTLGYLAPDWFRSGITEKIDVYSFGVVVLEILCGRRNIDRSMPEDQLHLLDIFRRKYEGGQLLELVDKQIEEMQVHNTEAMRLFHLAAWCLQSDFSRRPSMSMVVNVLESDTELDQNHDPNFINLPIQFSTIGYAQTEAIVGVDTVMQPSLLSGPR